jgi:hypothetical protein
VREAADFSHIASEDRVDWHADQEPQKNLLPEGFYFLPGLLDEAAQIALTIEVGHLLQVTRTATFL